jgi:tripartite-type tricarboxylate transporter receptor subunit TctC
MTVWHGLYAPRATPPNIIKTLSLSLQQVLQNPEFLLELEQLGVTAAEPQRANPEALRTHLELELERWAAVIHKNQQYAD